VIRTNVIDRLQARQTGRCLAAGIVTLSVLGGSPCCSRSRLFALECGAGGAARSWRAAFLKRGPEPSYALSSDQVFSPHSHLNIRTVRPLWGLSIFKRSLGLSPHWHVGTGFGSKLEKTSFLNSSFIRSLAGDGRRLSYKVNICSDRNGLKAKGKQPVWQVRHPIWHLDTQLPAGKIMPRATGRALDTGEDQAWLQHHVMRPRLALRYAKSRETELSSKKS
jgi:hypothetical protein